MKEEELPTNLRNALFNLRNSSSTIACDIEDALNSANCVEEFKDGVSQAMDGLIGEAESVKKMIADEKDEWSPMSGVLTIAEARQIADEILRSVVRLEECRKFKDSVGRELDLTDEILDQAADLLFPEEVEMIKKGKR